MARRVAVETGSDLDAARLIAGLLFAPLGVLLTWAATIAVLNSGVPGLVTPGAIPSPQPFGALWWQALQQVLSNPVMVAAAYGVEGLLGFPIHLWLQREGYRSMWGYLTAGALIPGILAALIWSLVAGRVGVLMSLGLIVPSGLVWGAVFWLIAVWGTA